MNKPLLLDDMLAFITANPVTDGFAVYALGYSRNHNSSKKLLYWDDSFAVICAWDEPLYQGTDAAVAIDTFNYA